MIWINFSALSGAGYCQSARARLSRGGLLFHLPNVSAEIPDDVSLFSQNGGNPALVLGRDFDLFRLETTIGLRNVRGQRIQLLLPPIPGARAASRYGAGQDQQPHRRPPPSCRVRRSRSLAPRA